jgi:ferritin-like metal-binding protein YciE
MSISSLQQLFEHEVGDLHSAETQIIAALPKMINMATHEELRAALEDHLEVTKEQLARLNSICDEHGLQKPSTSCEGMKGIIAEGEKLLKEIDDKSTKDAAIIAAAQRVEHYEIAGYGTAVEYANQLGYDDVAETLHDTLDEEKEADENLTTLATGGWLSDGLNEEAMDGETE